MQITHSAKKQHLLADRCSPDDVSNGEYRYCRIEGLHYLLRADTPGDRIFHDVLAWHPTVLGSFSTARRCVFRDVHLHAWPRACRFAACGFHRVRFTGRTAGFSVHPVSLGIPEDNMGRREEAATLRDFYGDLVDFAIDVVEAEFDTAPFIAGVPQQLLRGRPGRDAYVGAGQLEACLSQVPGDSALALSIEDAQRLDVDYGCTVHAVGDGEDTVKALVDAGLAKWLDDGGDHP